MPNEPCGSPPRVEDGVWNRTDGAGENCHVASTDYADDNRGIDIDRPDRRRPFRG